MDLQPRPVRVRLSPGQARRVAQSASTGTIATAAEVAARVAAASMPAPRDQDASPPSDTDSRPLASVDDPGPDAAPAQAWHPDGYRAAGASDLAVRLQAFELGDLFRRGDVAALGEMTPAQLRAQVTARERLHRHALRVLDLAEADRTRDARERAAAAGVVDLLGLLCEHARGEHPQAAAPVGPRPRRPLAAPAHLWADTAAPATPRAAHEPAPEVSGVMVCGRCGLPLERSDLAAALGRPASQGWHHVDGRKTHFPQPVPEPPARRTPHTPDSAAA